MNAHKHLPERGGAGRKERERGEEKGEGKKGKKGRRRGRISAVREEEERGRRENVITCARYACCLRARIPITILSYIIVLIDPERLSEI